MEGSRDRFAVPIHDNQPGRLHRSRQDDRGVVAAVINLAMHPVAQIITLRLMAVTVAHRISPRDDGLHLEEIHLVAHPPHFRLHHAAHIVLQIHMIHQEQAAVLRLGFQMVIVIPYQCLALGFNPQAVNSFQSRSPEHHV